MAKKSAKKGLQTELSQDNPFHEAVDISAKLQAVEDAEDAAKVSDEAKPVIPAPVGTNGAAGNLTPEVEAIVRYLTSKAASDVDKAVELVRDRRIAEQQRKVDEARATFVAAQKALAELEGSAWSEGSNPAPRTTSKPRKPRTTSGASSASAEKNASEIIAWLNKHAGEHKAGAIQSATGISKADWVKAVPVARGIGLKDNGGVKNGVRWFTKK